MLLRKTNIIKNDKIIVSIALMDWNSPKFGRTLIKRLFPFNPPNFMQF